MRLRLGLAALAVAWATVAYADPLTFQVDPAWPKPLPNHWIMGQASGVAVDAQDNIWVVQRPRTPHRRREGREPDAAAHQVLPARARRCWCSTRPAT